MHPKKLQQKCFQIQQDFENMIKINYNSSEAKSYIDQAGKDLADK